MHDFSVEVQLIGVERGQFFTDLENFNYWTKPQFAVIFQEFLLKLMKIWEIIERIGENTKFSRMIFIFIFARD